MKQPIVIVDPLSSGIELAPALRAQGIPAIAVTFKPLDRMGFGTQVIHSDFIATIPDQPNLVEILREYNPMAILPGTESGVALAEELAAQLTPQFSNDPKKYYHRQHKGLMQQALEDAGVPALKSISSASEEEVEQWLHKNSLVDAPLIIKPPVSAGSDKVFHIDAKSDWRNAFRRVLAEPSKITKKLSETAVVQEQALGTEYAVGTVSANGKHSLAHLIKYNKTSSADRKTVFDYVEFIPFDPELHGELLAYTKQVLDALGIRWGAAHTEIMLTKNGPRLIETGARMCGGPVVGFAREATGSSQADKLAEIFGKGSVQSEQLNFKKTVIPVFLKATSAGTIANAEVLAEISELPFLFQKNIWIKNGIHVPQTVDYLTSIGIIGLAGERTAILRDYQKIRELEAKLVIN